MSEKRKGPKLTVTRSCDGCRYEASESYAVQGDSGFRVLCEHPHLGVRRIGDTTWTTPEWCPERGSESAPESAALASEREARQRAEQQRDELLSDWKEIDALPPVRAAFEEGMMLVDAVAKAIADSHYAEGTPLFDAEVAKSFAEAERDEARAERDVAVKGREHAISVQVSEGIRADRAEQQRDEARAQLEALRVAVAAYVADEDEDRTTTFDAMAAVLADLPAAGREHERETLRRVAVAVKSDAVAALIAAGEPTYLIAQLDLDAIIARATERRS